MHNEPSTWGQKGNILIADDEETFRESTADLLRQEGYACTCVGTAEDVIVLVNSQVFDLLIADIRMPGNEQLELLKRIESHAIQTPIIVVTAYPTAETAITSIHASVFDYFTKPIEFLEFLPKVEQAVAWSNACRAVGAMRTQLSNWQDDITSFEKGLANVRALRAQSLNDLASLAHGHLVVAAREVRRVTTTTNDNWKLDMCRALGCNHCDTLLQAVRDAVAVLERTKGSFKSKEIRDLRISLQQILLTFSSNTGEIQPE